ncbi:hypothetical protein [Cupriavidus pauculus]|uniref:hypothetical protein n=1 Tax=Cupriavidus pauculus TaxID=82633 RepID=UPI001EE20CDF|nr:hypothetical protein [Cupriavidus pauculus]GJG96659.1 hypothetical protein CBA19C6_19240 [Cupriavidus pauculus]
MNATAESQRIKVSEAIDNVIAGLERAMSGMQELKALLSESEPKPEFDPKDPSNKYPDGKLTARGIEVCYRLFEAGYTRYKVAALMGIAFNSADNRYHTWKHLGGADRVKMPLE